LLPIALDPTKLRIGLTGEGDALARRKAFLQAAGVEQALAADAGRLDVLFVVGLPREQSAALAAQARAAGTLVNVEDVPELCDFHVPAVVRRGDLALTVSTNGKAPAISRLIREWLERAFGPQWSGRLQIAAHARERWRSEGCATEELSRRSRELVAREGWLP